MSENNNYRGKLSLDSYNFSRKELKQAVKDFNSKLENIGLSEFSLQEFVSCSSAVYRNFGEQSIIFSLVKERPERGALKYTHVAFNNQINLDKKFNQKLEEATKELNNKILNSYQPHRLN